MLKIPKGLKKKKKGKKSKKKGEEELFTEEELEQYRREHQNQAQQEQQQQQHQESDQGYAEQQPKQQSAEQKNDEWSKFNALTTGVDSILKKTQGDLDRIKSTSFFQRVPAGPKAVDQCGKELPPKPEPPKQARPEGEAASARAQPEEAAAAPPPEPVVSESESEEEDFDDIFDTSYVEAVEKGEVKLAYVPDSPDQEVDDGPDPFDTSYADKVIKGPEVSKKGKKLVNIGAAVEVLTGRIDHVTTSSAAIKKAKRRIPRDLLLENPDPDDFADAQVEDTNAGKSLLDDDTEDIPKDVPVDLSVSLHTQFIPPKSEDDAEGDGLKKRDILNDFDGLVQDDDDEFAQLATESLCKPVAVAPEPDEEPVPVEPVVDDASWASFADSKAKPDRPPPPRPAAGPCLSPDEFDCDEGPDPFDTTFAENILPGKAELKQLEKEILADAPAGIPNSDSDFDFDPRADEQPRINNRRKSSVHIHITDPTGIRESISGFGNADDVELDSLKPIHRDLLGGSSTDLSQLGDLPIAPSAALDDNDQFDYSDPFDTSIADIIAPGKTELKFIEKELLGESASDLKRSLSDPDFDPRADPEPPKPVTSARKPSRPENLLVNKAVLFKVPTEGEGLLPDKDAKKSKPLTPYYNKQASITDEDVDTQEDPFDASFADFTVVTNKPVVSILKNSQNASEIKRSTSDQDLNAEEEEEVKGKFSQLRRHSDFPIGFSRPSNFGEAAKNRTDFLSITEEESVDTKVLTPYQEDKQEGDSEIDPFDTSLVNDAILPKKAELKFLENELLKQEPVDLNDPDFDPRAEKKNQPEDLLAPDDDVFQVKALTPEITNPAGGFLIDTTEEEEIDPFDTSIADNIGPGKTELKLLENELMN